MSWIRNTGIHNTECLITKIKTAKPDLDTGTNTEALTCAAEVEGRGLVSFEPVPVVCSKEGGTTYTKNTNNFKIVQKITVADPGCLSRIPE
jgi:hypothetical protein